MTVGGKAIQILLVEDDAGHARLMEQAFRDDQIPNHFALVTDGEQAVAYIRRQPPFADAPRPDLVLLDLDLPRRNGCEVLKDIKGDERLRTIPIIVVTTSQEEHDVVAAYKARANAYLVKPVDFDQFMYVVRALARFWLNAVTLPGRAEA